MTPAGAPMLRRLPDPARKTRRKRTLSGETGT